MMTLPLNKDLATCRIFTLSYFEYYQANKSYENMFVFAMLLQQNVFHSNKNIKLFKHSFANSQSNEMRYILFGHTKSLPNLYCGGVYKCFLSNQISPNQSIVYYYQVYLMSTQNISRS